MDKAVGIGDAEKKTNHIHIHWYVPHYTPSIQQRGILSNQILSRTPTELRYIERSVFMKKVKTRIHGNLNWVVRKTGIFLHG